MATKQPGNSSGVMNSIFDSFIATSKSKDIEALNKSINNLSKILERRVGKVKKSSESAEDKEDSEYVLSLEQFFVYQLYSFQPVP